MKWLFVIARNSSFTYKGRAVDIKQVGRELGVQYVLEGSVRKAGNRIRITGQLIDTSNGVIWPRAKPPIRSKMPWTWHSVGTQGVAWGSGTPPGARLSRNARARGSLPCSVTCRGHF